METHGQSQILVPSTAKAVEGEASEASEGFPIDGPFAETHEHLGGFYLIEAKTLDDALAFAAAIPVANYGSVEVRPVETFE